MKLSNIHIIPDCTNMKPYLELSKQYGIKFEYNDFILPFNLDNPGYKEEKIDYYNSIKDMPSGNTLHGSFLDVTVFSKDAVIRKASRNRIIESMTIADKLGAKAVIIHTNCIPNYHDESYESYWLEGNKTFYDQLLADFPNISLYMENMFDETPDLILSLAKAMEGNDRFGLCLDYAHVKVFGKSDESEWIERMAPYVKHIHINDNDLTKDSHLALGDGAIDYKKFFELYEKYFADISVLIEVNGLDKIQKSLDYILKNCNITND